MSPAQESSKELWTIYLFPRRACSEAKSGKITVDLLRIKGVIRACSWPKVTAVKNI